MTKYKALLAHFESFANKERNGGQSFKRLFQGEEVPTALLQIGYAIAYPLHANALADHERQIAELRAVLDCNTEKAAALIKKHGYSQALQLAKVGAIK